jgi:hypothetical protein
MTLFKGIGNCQNRTAKSTLTIAIFTWFMMFTEGLFFGRFKFCTAMVLFVWGSAILRIAALCIHFMAGKSGGCT